VWGRLGVGLALLATIAACESAPAPPDAPPNVVRAAANGFVLETSIPKRVWGSTEVIPVTTTLTWTGAVASQRVGTSTDGPVSFGLKQLDGTLEMGGGHDLVCDHKSFDRGVATPIRFGKSGGWTDDDPNAAFYREFYADPRLILPPGHWRLSVTTDGFIGDCQPGAPRLDLALPPIDLLVLPAAS
jgi:hypothetical protein